MTAIAPAAGSRDTALRAGAAASAQRVLAVARRHATVLFRSPHRYFDVALWPAVDTLLFGAIGAFFARNSTVAGGTALRYLLIGVVLWHVVYQAQISLSTGFMEETWSRNVLSLAVTPLAPWEYVAGVLLFGLVKMVVGVGGVVVIAVTAYGLDLHTLTVGIVPVVVMLLVCGYAIAFGVIGLMLRYGSGAEAFAWGILFVVMPLSGVFYPITALPSVIQPLSRALPTTYLFSLGRTLTETGRLPAGTLVAAAVSTVAVTALTFAYCAWMMSLFRRRGYITRWS